MKLDELLTWASANRSRLGIPEGDVIALANGIVATLGVAFPCGFPEPHAIGTETPRVIWPEVFDDELSPDEARGIAAALLRAADEAELSR
jgi:hypothetical protein